MTAARLTDRDGDIVEIFRSYRAGWRQGIAIGEVFHPQLEIKNPGRGKPTIRVGVTVMEMSRISRDPVWAGTFLKRERYFAMMSLQA